MKLFPKWATLSDDEKALIGTAMWNLNEVVRFAPEWSAEQKRMVRKLLDKVEEAEAIKLT